MPSFPSMRFRAILSATIGYCVSSVGPDAPADYFLRERIKDKRQVAEVVAGIAVHDDNVRYITHPELVRCRRNKVLNDVRIRR